MSFKFFADEVAFREQTERQATMPGVTRPSFRCAKCGCSKGVSGRKRLSVGWRCADCEEALQDRLARKAMKGAA